MLSSFIIIIFKVGSKSLTGVSPGNFLFEHILARFVYFDSLEAELIGEDVRRLTIENNELELNELRLFKRFLI